MTRPLWVVEMRSVETRDDFEERAAIVEEGNPGMTRAQAERLVRSWWEQAGRLDFSNRGAQQTHGSRVQTPSQNRIVGSFYGQV